MTRTLEQRAAIETLAKRVCVDAGAGSGKTSVLIDRIIHLIEQGHAPLEKIAAITFTEKAAAEMKIRLRKAFRTRAPRDDPEAMSRWRYMEQQVETSRIATIHAFCAALLREHALRMGFDPDFTVLAEAEAALLRSETITDTVHRLLERRDEAAMRVATEFGTQEVIKTLAYLLRKRGPIERIRNEHPLREPAALVQHWRRLVAELNDARLLSVARNPKLAHIVERLQHLAGACSKSDDAREAVRRQALALAVSLVGCSDARAIHEALAEVGDIGLRGGSKKNWDSEDSFVAVKEAVEDLRAVAKACAPFAFDEATEARAAQLTSDVFVVFEKVLGAYQRAKNARAGRDFDDLLSAAAEVLRENAEIRARTARGIAFLMIDEFQDTDTTQIELARLLAAEPEGPSLFVVGDAKQSIYDFRGAEVEVFQAAKSEADEVIPLARNFRTLPNVMNFVNDFFQSSGLLQAVEPDYVPLIPHRDPAEGHRVEFLIPEFAEKTSTDAYRAQEAALIAWRLDEMCRGAGRVQVHDAHAECMRPAEFGDVALLFRSMSSIYIYEEALRERGIPYSVIAGAGFYERQEVRDLRNLLTVIIDPHDEMALLGFLRSPIAGLSDETLAQLCAEQSLVNAMRPGAPTPQVAQPDRLETARALVADLRAHADMALPAFLRYTLDRTGLESIVLAQFLGLQKASNVRKVVDLADDFSRTQPAKLTAFVQYLDQVAGQEEVREGDAALQPEGSGSVTLMTIHKSKGLEFPIVVVPDLARGRNGPDARVVAVHAALGMAACPNNDLGERVKPAIHQAIYAAAQDKDVAEHARVLYVAMTRARDWLLLGGNPEPSKGSWLAEFDALYNATSREHGNAFSGSDWAAMVYRNGQQALRSEASVATSATSWEAFASRVEPIPEGQRTARVFSVSELLDAVEGVEDAEDPVAIRSGAYDPLLRGTLVHSLFERWPLDADDVDAEALIESFLPRACPALDVRRPVAAYLRATAERFAQSEILAMMRAARRVERETPFLLRVGDGLISGTVDAILDDGTLIDYKTGRRKEDKEERYAQQLRLYAAAVWKLLGRQPASAFVYYADTGEHAAVDVSPERMAEALARAAEAIAGLD